MGRTTDLASRNKQVLMERGEDILQHYLTNYNVTEILEVFSVSRKPVENFLKARGVYKNQQQVVPFVQNAPATKRLKTMQERYGVVNFGQTPHMVEALAARNAIAFQAPALLGAFEEYRRLVNHYTQRNKKFVVKVDCCYYTGIRFSDSEGLVNPNDPRKRTLDHKISVYEGFLKDIDASIIGATSNLVWCLRYCNSIKGNMSSLAFQELAVLIREKLINEGFSSN